MSDQADPKNKPEETSSEAPAKTKLKPSGEVVVRHTDTPPPGPSDKRIHPRHPLPPVPNPTKPVSEKEKEDP